VWDLDLGEFYNYLTFEIALSICLQPKQKMLTIPIFSFPPIPTVLQRPRSWSMPADSSRVSFYYLRRNRKALNACISLQRRIGDRQAGGQVMIYGQRI
jgi:hypothetical protein